MKPEKTIIYFAGPLFTQGEWLWNARLANRLRNAGFEVILPQATAEPMLKDPKSFNANALFTANTAGIEQCDVVLAILDQADPDSGTCWECGYAYKAGRPIIGVRTDIRRAADDTDAGVNLMLSKSCEKLVVIPMNKLDDDAWVFNEIVTAIEGIRP
jgi:nucleoside 2-deoxyribosyltransferase